MQVIGQQWEFTYRYPSLGGFETNQLMLPANTDVVLHVTSLDVVHSFWAVELGVKADANPGVDNVAYVETQRGAHVPRPLRRALRPLPRLHVQQRPDRRAATLAKWAKEQQRQFAPIAKYVPPYATTYFPDPQRRAG